MPPVAPIFLTTEEFQRWAAQFDKRLEKIEGLKVDVAVMKDRARRNGKRTALLVTTASGLLTWALEYFFHYGRP